MKFKIKDKELVLLGAQILFLSALFIFNSYFWLFFLVNIVIVLVGSYLILDVKRENLKSYLVYLAMPLLYFLGSIFFLNTIKSFLLQGGILLFYVISNLIFIINIKRLRQKKEEVLVTSRNIISMISLIIVFLLATDIINAYMFYKLPGFFFLLIIFGAIALITYFLLIIYELLSEDTLPYIYLISFLIMEIAWAGSFWLVNYPKSKIGELGVPLTAIIILIFYYNFWGVAQHKLMGTLTKKVLTEYVAIAGIIIAILLVTTKWLPLGVVN
ncbi:MAG: hypothetical protein M1355_03665 [Patescibacteria group bacterium]|nr:hypothetical protein [Patescibacteria group bacterium]MCL5094203.1 hypothetical protein [Patescibacteria group bacterium]